GHQIYAAEGEPPRRRRNDRPDQERAARAHAELHRLHPLREGAQLPVRSGLPHFDRVPDGGRELSSAAHHALGRGQGRDRLRPWTSSTRRNSFNCVNPFANSLKPKSLRTSWSGMRRRPFRSKWCKSWASSDTWVRSSPRTWAALGSATSNTPSSSR